MGVPIWLRTGDVSGIAPARKKPKGPVWLIAESSRGLGLTLAKAVLRQGHLAVLATRNTAAVQDLANTFPHTAAIVALDGTKPDDIARVIQEGKARFGSIDFLVNTAGVGYVPAVEKRTGEDTGRQVHVDFSGLDGT
ncbi:SDR family NAD(P)-dependent oxidoreductase [Microvirga yunnanensis]|uniref:SDR family NAD(P)-dependent oxidoreductase n=1 Tax=Microvirga yunnanensis TaxID=2953740 RepID=UPI0021C6E37C|nr:SDR family NAD(P)-dependent oxidoreductase [Microvirga sp. HBU65207]